jgi:hypothetical protein
MKKQEVAKLVDYKIREVAKVFSQNSTPLAREMTINIAIKEIVEAIEQLLEGEMTNDSSDPKSKSRRTNL